MPWPIGRGQLTYTCPPQPLRRILAWEVQPEGEDATAIWKTECIAAAFDADQDIALITPILMGDTGGWMYETFKKKGCEHCHNYRQQAIVLRLVKGNNELYSIQDGAKHTLTGLTHINLREAPIRAPRDFSAMTLNEATIIRQALRAGYCRPIFV